MTYRDLPWRDNPEPDDQPTDAEMALETPPGQSDPVLVVPLDFFTGDDQTLPNELFDAPDETDRLHAYVEDLLSGPEPYEGNVYDGTDNSDPAFFDDRDWE